MHKRVLPQYQRISIEKRGAMMHTNSRWPTLRSVYIYLLWGVQNSLISAQCAHGSWPGPCTALCWKNVRIAKSVFVVVVAVVVVVVGGARKAELGRGVQE